MSPIAPVMASRSYSKPPIEGEKIHPSLAGLYFTPMAANTLKDTFVNKMHAYCSWGVCTRDYNELRQQWAQLLRRVDDRVQPRIDGNSQRGMYVIGYSAVLATENLVKLVAGQGKSYTYDHIVAAGGLMVYDRTVKPVVQVKVGKVLLEAALHYFASFKAEFEDHFEPAVYPIEPMNVDAYLNLLRQYHGISFRRF